MSEPTEHERPGPRHVRQAGTLIAGKAVATLSDAITPILLVRLLDKDQVGVFVGILLGYGTLATVLTSGFPATLMYFLATRDAPARRAIAWKLTLGMFALGLATSVVMAAGGVVAWAQPRWASNLGLEASALLLGMAAYPLGEIPSRILQNLLIVEGRADRAMTFGVLKSFGTTLATVLPIALGGGLWSAVLSLSVFGVLCALAVVWVLRAVYAGVAHETTGITFRELLRFAIPVGLTDVIASLNSTFDRYLVMVAYPVAMLAEYQAGAWQIPIITSIPYMVGAVYTPMYTRMLADGRAGDAIGVWRLSVEKVSLLVVPLTAVFIVGSEETVRLLFTDSYESAANIFRWYAIFTLGRVAAFGPLLIAAGRPQYVMHAAFRSLLANMVLGSTLMALFGVVGPAMGTAFAFIPTVYFYCSYVAKATGLPLADIFPTGAYLRVIATCLVPCGLAWLFKYAVPMAPAVALGIEAVIVLSSFSVIGTLTGLITRADWAVVRGLGKPAQAS